MKNTFLIFLILISFTLMNCSPSTKHIPSITNFDADKYLGKWYEIARLDHSFERGLNYVTAEYSIKDNKKIKVLNRGIKQDGTTSTAEGKAYIVKSDNNKAELKVSFFLFFYASYRVIWLDDDYTTSVVTSNRMNYLWILSRSPKISDELKEELLKFCKDLGFETQDLIFPEQK